MLFADWAIVAAVVRSAAHRRRLSSSADKRFSHRRILYSGDQLPVTVRRVQCKFSRTMISVRPGPSGTSHKHE
jgi:hypothetical protein